MIDRAHFLIFLSAAVVLAVSPGPGMIYVLARSLRGGRAIGLASCLGTAARDPAFPTATVEQDAGRPFWQGMLTEVLNPKTALFFLALIPQFINHTASVVPQFLMLGAISVTLNTMADIAVVLAAVRLERRLKSSTVWQLRQRQVAGVALVGLGGYVAVS